MLLAFFSSRALAMFPHCLDDQIFFENSFGSMYDWRSMVRIFSAVRPPLVIYKSESKTVKEVLSNSAPDRALSWFDIDTGTA